MSASSSVITKKAFLQSMSGPISGPSRNGSRHLFGRSRRQRSNRGDGIVVQSRVVDADIGQRAGKSPAICYGAADQEIDCCVRGGIGALVQQRTAVPDLRPKALVQNAILENILVPRASRSREAPSDMVPLADVAYIAAVTLVVIRAIP